MAHTGEAYDLERFKPREAQLVALSNTAKVKKDNQKRARRQSMMNLLVYLTLGALAMCLVGYLITCNVRLTEMNKTLADGQVQLNVLQSEQVRLKSELSALTSAERINAYAQENGMLPADRNQIYYITANEEDQVSLAEKNESWFSKAWNAVKNFLS